MKKLCACKAKNAHTFFKKILHHIFPPVELNTFFFFLFFLLEIFLRSRVDEHSRIIKSRVMLKNKVRTYSVHRETPKMAIFILNRGRNAGKPLRQPCPNCFIIYCKDENEVENYYWTFFSLWKSKFFHRFLCGSVIDMLRITDLKKILIEKVQPNFENFEKNQILIERLKTVEKLNSEYSRRVQVLEKLRHQLIYHFYFVK